jgi:hypothetical protein
MRIVLRIVALVTGLAVLQTVLLIAQIASSGGLMVLGRSGALGFATFGAWFVILVAGPVASVQLWRLRRNGLFTTTALCALALVYYLVGFLFLRAQDAPVGPIVVAILLNGAVVALLVSPAARRVCAAER